MEKILFIITRMVKGGAQEVVKALAEADDWEGVLVTGEPLDLKPNVRTIVVPELIRELNLFLDIVAFIKLYLIIKREKPAVVHTHTSKAGFLGRIAARIAGAKRVIHTPHGSVFSDVHFSKLKQAIFWLAEKLTAQLADAIVTVSDAEKEEYIRLKIAPEDKYTTIYNGIDMDRFRDAEPKEIGASGITIGSISRMVKGKGHITLVRAAEGIDAMFVLVGDGPERQKIEEEIDRLGLKDRFILLGERSDVPEILNSLDIFCHLSEAEGLPVAIIEAMCAGLAIAATDVGGTKEILGDCGILIPPNDVEGLRCAILKLINDEGLRTELSKKARDRAKLFSKERMVSQYRMVYNEG
jgi:glycosyltransferase involved in cell wall biosynthesis